ncbi:MAG: biopolymer transporter ExbD [bacterium]|nr:biopolymer transporter ExbD [bacterium]
MGMGGGHGAEDPITEINVTPLVDICLVLVIIFMVTVPIMMTSSPIEVKLPRANTMEAREDVNVTVAINPTDSAAVDTRACTLMELPQFMKEAVEAKGTDKMLIIRADKEVNHDRVLLIMDIAKKLGCSRISVATTQQK